MKLAVAVLLVIMINGGCSRDNNMAQADPRPVAQFKINLTMSDGVKEGDLIKFENQSANGLSYLWEFGDGFTSEESNPAHIYSCGTFTVKLTVTGKSGVSAKINQELQVYCAGRGVHGG